MTKTVDLFQDKQIQDPKEIFALDVLMGFTSDPKKLSPMYMYDRKGSELFEQIMDLEEYYPTRCETEIFENRKSEIIRACDSSNLRVIELGAGDGRKTRILLKEFISAKRTLTYVPVDISRDAVVGLMEKLKSEFPSLEGQGLVAEYFEAIRWLNNAEAHARNLVLFLGSNIGNFSRAQSGVFLKTLWNVLNPGDLVLIGFDLKKDLNLLWRAYNDSKGITRELNLNVLSRINSELGGNFRIDCFEHVGNYNVQSGAMESYLVSKEQQSVDIRALNKRFDFKPYESIHMEYSYKFLPEEIHALALDTGFSIEAEYYDEKRYFVDVILRVQKGEGF